MTQRKKTNLTSQEPEKKLTRKEIITSIIKKKTKEKFLTENQKIYNDLLLNRQIVICSGPAGTGKSYIALKTAVNLLFDSSTSYEKIIILRPAVESSDSTIGLLPGDVREKMDPYVYASFHLLNKIIGQDVVKKLEELGFIEVMAINFIRGLNIDNSILVGEEFQNVTPNEMKTILTRIGFNSKFFISGDIEQTDKFKQIEKSGLYDAMQRLSDIEDIGLFKFGLGDIVRNPIITKILERY
jgi:phosphate starvation-inducible PhoH-like protein